VSKFIVLEENIIKLMEKKHQSEREQEQIIQNNRLEIQVSISGLISFQGP